MYSVSLRVWPTSTARLEGLIIFIFVTCGGRTAAAGPRAREAGGWEAGCGGARFEAGLSVHNLHGQVELINHAQRNGATAGLAVVHLALNEEGLDARRRQRVRGAGTGGATTHHLENTGSSRDFGSAAGLRQHEELKNCGAHRDAELAVQGHGPRNNCDALGAGGHRQGAAGRLEG